MQVVNNIYAESAEIYAGSMQVSRNLTCVLSGRGDVIFFFILVTKMRP